MNIFQKRGFQSSNPISLVAACGLAIGLSSSIHSVQAQDAEAREYEPGQGYHDEEWYDPSDWFDDDFDGMAAPDTDVEADWYNYEGYASDMYASYDDTRYYSGWWYDTDRNVYVDAYYDGYVDGYADDEFGYDYFPLDNTSGDNRVAERYNEGYVSGYYDGFYDSEQGFESDWTYYMFATPVSKDREKSQRERSDDASRSRGDRADEARTDRMSKKDASRYADEGKRVGIRGTVNSLEVFSDDQVASNAKSNVVLGITMQNGKRVTVDLGPKASKDVIAKGDRVTIHGKRMKRNGREVLDATKLSVNGNVLWNRSDQAEPKQMSAR